MEIEMGAVWLCAWVEGGRESMVEGMAVKG